MHRELSFILSAAVLLAWTAAPSFAQVDCCDSDPCAVHKCPKYPEAKCRYDCGKCKATYFTDDGDISDRGCLKIEPCPPFTPVARCTEQPCRTARCPRFKDAICVDNYCGGCNADFYLDGKKVTSQCSDGGVGDCRDLICDVSKCKQASCRHYPEATCEADPCANCRTVFKFEGQIATDAHCDGTASSCPGFTSKLNCLRNPCDGVTCPGVPGATCIPRYCGECKAVFVNARGRLIDESRCVGLEKCPKNVPMAGCACFKEPCECLGETCPLKPDAKCLIDGCGGCNVLFFDGRKRLTNEDCQGCMPFGFRKNCDPCASATCPDHPDARCEARRCKQCKAAFFGLDRKEIKSCCKNDEMCADGTRKFHCKKNPCDGARCPHRPDATCRPNYCGGCKAEFYIGDRRLSDEDCVIYERCCTGFFCPPRVCSNPCGRASCPAHPEAKCANQECGRCRAIFYNKERDIVDCGIRAGTCPDGSANYRCLVDQCKVESCPSVPNANCRTKSCGGCKAEFSYPSGDIIPTYECMGAREPCPPDSPRAKCMGSMCRDNPCRMVPSADCYIDGCGGCSVVFFLGSRRLTDEDCKGCPLDKPKMDCGDMCKDAACPLYPYARCETRVCGECRVVFFGQDRKEIKDCCGSSDSQCPAGVKEHTCIINPCDLESCPAEPLAECRPNYCGGCKAEFFLNGRKLTDIECVKNPDECAAFTTCLVPCDCPAVPDAQCVVQYCEPNRCKSLFFDKTGKKLSNEDCGLCADGSKYINCGFVPQCRFDKCPAHPEAKCRSSNCGVCRTWFEDENGNEVNCNGKPTQCPQDAVVVACVVDPCKFAKCPARPEAECRSSTCGSCHAEFFVGNRKLSDMECVKNPDECIAFTTCIAKACSCPVVPGAQCIRQYCSPNSCQYLYFDEAGNSLSYEQCGLCENGEAPINCGIVPQCLVDKCDAFPDAKCRSTNCGKCRTYFVDDQGNEVDCAAKQECSIPPGIANGFLLLPRNQKIYVGDSVYYACKKGYIRIGRSSRKCVLRGKPRIVGIAPRCRDINECARAPCHSMATCTNTPGSFFCTCMTGYTGNGSECTAVTTPVIDGRCPRDTDVYACANNCRSSSECGYQQICCLNTCGKSCVDIPGLCPGGASPAQCYVDPCLGKKCRRNPSARCVADYCKGCVAEFFIGDRRVSC